MRCITFIIAEDLASYGCQTDFYEVFRLTVFLLFVCWIVMLTTMKSSCWLPYFWTIQCSPDHRTHDNTLIATALVSQSALFQMGTFRCVFLLSWALTAVSTIMTPSWSEMPGMVSMFFISPGLFVQNRSRMASSRVVDLCSWCWPASPRILRRRLHKLFFIHCGSTISLFQSISLVLKSPAMMIPDLGFLAVIVFSSSSADSKLSRLSVASLGGL